MIYSGLASPGSSPAARRPVSARTSYSGLTSPGSSPAARRPVSARTSYSGLTSPGSSPAARRPVSARTSYSGLASPGSSPAARRPVSARTSFPDYARHGGAHIGGAFDRGDARRLHRLHLLGRCALAARDDGAGMAHAPAGRRRLPADEADHGLRDVGLDEGRGFLLGRAADLADHHDRFRLRIGLEEAQHVDEARAVHGIAADAHAGGLDQAALGQLMDHLVRERAAA